MAIRLLICTLALLAFSFVTVVMPTPIDQPPVAAVAVNDSDRIVGGVDATFHEFPYIVSIRDSATNSHFCGGSIMSPNWVLTAAHCIERPPNNAQYKIVAGAHNLAVPNADEQTVAVDGIWIHPQNDPDTYENDLALLHVTPPFVLNGVAVASIALPSAHHHSQPPDQAVVAGWGRLTENGALPTVLQKVTVDLVDDAFCVETYQHVPDAPRLQRTTTIAAGRVIFLVDPKIEVCYAAPGKDSCQGDSGGPLVDVQPSLARGGGAAGHQSHWHSRPCQVGVVSFGNGCAKPGFPGIYVRLSAFTDWIQYTIATKGPAPTA